MKGIPATSTVGEIETRLNLRRIHLRSTLAVAGAADSSPDATRAAGEMAAELKEEISALEGKLMEAAGKMEAA